MPEAGMELNLSGAQVGRERFRGTAGRRGWIRVASSCLAIRPLDLVGMLVQASSSSDAALEAGRP